MRQYGKIRISELAYKNFWKHMKGRFIPYSIEFNYLAKEFIVSGEHDWFEPLVEGALIPFYMPIFKKDTLGRVKLIKMDNF